MTKLTVSPEALRTQFYNLKSPQDVAEMLEVEYKHLIYYLYRHDINTQYTQVEISKRSGGRRILRVPTSSIKILQSKLYEVLQVVYEPKSCVHGFVPGKSIVTNADAHLQRRKRTFILNVDIEDFFPSINFGRVRGLFIASPYNLPKKVATVIAQICCVDNQLPQGAPSSPIIANMICAKLDAKLQQLAKIHKCFYTRYADDLTFSTSVASFPLELAYFTNDGAGKHLIVGDTLSDIIEANGFKINSEKVRLQRSDRRQEVTGITVNKIANVPRSYINQIRAMLHAWKKYGLEKAEEHHFTFWKKSHTPDFTPTSSFATVIRGKIEYIGMVRGTQSPTYKRLMQKLMELDPSIKKHDLLQTRNQVFISYSHKDEKWLNLVKTHLRPIERYNNIEIWDDTRIPSGSKWNHEIEVALNSAKVAVLLVSKNFFASDFIAKVELPSFLRAAEKDGLKILWIAVGASAYANSPIKEYQSVNDPQKPLSTLDETEIDKVLVHLCEEILAFYE